MHHITVELLRDSFLALKRDAAPGVDDVTWRQYDEQLEERLPDLHERVQSGRYRAMPSKRVWIPKPHGRQRPIGIAVLEDKIVQQAVVKVLNQIYEEAFLGFSYGFRPNRHQHRALDVVWIAIMQRRINWVLDADIRGFFDTIDHEWLMRFLEHRIADPGILRLIRKWLRAGVGNKKSIDAFRTQVMRSWFWALRRRSQKACSLTWDRLKRLVVTWLPTAKVRHLYPNERLCVINPR
jgi:group II intron reverse transcriptase/maturase